MIHDSNTLQAGNQIYEWSIAIIKQFKIERMIYQ